MLIRISLIVAIIAGLAVGGLNFVKMKEKVTKLQADLQEQTVGRQKAETDLAETRAELEKTNAILKQAQAALASATEERDKATAEAVAQTKRGDQLAQDLNKTRQERDVAQAALERYRSGGLAPEQVIAAKDVIKNLQNNLAGQQEENTVLQKKIGRLKNELARFLPEEKVVYLPAALKGKVVAADPKWNFVVLDIGQGQGVVNEGELLVNRNGNLISKVKVSAVEKDRSVANVMPGWELTDVLEGDQVIPAHPGS